MSLVGDLILELRANGPDPPQLLGAPIISAIAPLSGQTPGIQTTTWYVKVSLLNPWGETLPSAESSIALTGAENGISVTLSAPSNVTVPNITRLRAYYGTATGQQNQFVEVDASQNPILITAPGTAGAPASRASALLPDSDGNFISAFLAYRWLNEALRAASVITGGIKSLTGVQSVANQSNYILSGQWKKISMAWYDGWEVKLGSPANSFYNSALTASIASQILVNEQADTTRVELFLIPDRTGGQTTLASPLAAADTVATVADSSSFGLGLGLCSIGSELLTYSQIVANQITGLVRGWGGSNVPASDPIDTLVTELNIRILGYRLPPVYSVGDSTKTLFVPPGWEPMLATYLLAKYREKEQERQEAASLKKEFQTEMSQYARQNRPVAGPQQLRPFDEYGLQGAVDIGGNLIIIP